MKQGSHRPAAFFAHGMGGDAMQLFYIARQMNIPNALYATQAPGIDALKAPIDRIEEMAELYLRAIKKLQPQGPYMLIGFSFGGLVMMEIAQRLCAEGQTIGLLAMLDTYPHRRNVSFWQQVPLVVRLGVRRLASFPFLAGKGEQHPESSLESARQRIHSAESVAWRRYRPRFYPGKIYFLKAAIPTYYPRNPRAVWAPLAKQFELHAIPGRHNDLVTTQQELTAHLLSQQLHSALGENSLREDQQ
jgi:thioesterase domain-containing protein